MAPDIFRLCCEFALTTRVQNGCSSRRYFAHRGRRQIGEQARIWRPCEDHRHVDEDAQLLKRVLAAIGGRRSDRLFAVFDLEGGGWSNGQLKTAIGGKEHDEKTHTPLRGRP